MIEASCHCGAIRLEINQELKSVTECNCSICRRLGAQWAYFRPDEVKVVSTGEGTGIYMWNDKEIEFHHCRNCGCTTHYESLGENPRRAVNARLIAIEHVKGTPVRRFDGASTFQALVDDPPRLVE